MNAMVGGEFGMERAGQACAVANENGLSTMSRENLHVGSEFGDEWRPDEDGVDGRVEAEDLDVGLERIDLPSVGVATHRHRNGVEVDLVVTTVLDALGQKDHAGTGAEERQARRHGTS